MVWNYRFYNYQLVECYYDNEGRPIAYCISGLHHYLDTQAALYLAQDHNSKETLVSFDEFYLQRYVEITQQVKDAIQCAIAYEEAGYPSLYLEFGKPVEQRTVCPEQKWAELGGKQNEKIVQQVLDQLKQVTSETIDFKVRSYRGKKHNTANRHVDFVLPKTVSICMKDQLRNIIFEADYDHNIPELYLSTDEYE